ncbi:PP2C family protein-serine/threonine phosphatase [Streptomyces sp. NPDC059134]|uniref:PP2C family protein-serine/threonine phosphatase n=1 Tax=Streptomyces sp. NPDC059134 TaxID=3346738 RepID=UPI0036CCEECC
MERPRAVERVLREAAPHEIFDALRALIERRHHAVSVELLMADYAMTELRLVHVLPHTAPPLPLLGTAAGRAFSTQEPHCVEGPGATVTVFVPVSVRGDRLGVLSVTLPGGTDGIGTDHSGTDGIGPDSPGTDGSGANSLDPGMKEEFRGYADALAHEIVVAERDTDLFLQARRTERLTLAAEMQWQLLPGRSCSRPEYSIGAQLEPAYAIFGDSFDWSASADDLVLTVSNGMGEGIDAALLTNLAVNALRNARRAGLDLAGQAFLADQAIYGQHQGHQYLSTLLLRFHLPTGDVEIIDAGSPRIWRLRADVVEPIEMDPQMPLGMFEDSVYIPQRFAVLPGDRLLFISDGVYDALSPAGEKYSLHALARVIIDTRLLPASQVPRAMLEELLGHRGSGPASDDSLVVCLDWHGRPSAA